jgi:hypothetical protein
MNRELPPPEHTDRWARNERLSIRRSIDAHIRWPENRLSGFDDELFGLIRHPKPPLAARVRKLFVILNVMTRASRAWRPPALDPPTSTPSPRWGAAAQHGCC